MTRYLLWWFVLDAWMMTVLAALLVGWFLGLVRTRTLAVVGILVLAGPVIEAWLGTLPGWIQAALLMLVALALVRDILALFIGDRAADHAVGDFAGFLLRLAFWTFILPFRVTGWVLRYAFHRLERMP